MRRYRDSEGDTWTEQSDGRFVLTDLSDHGRDYELGVISSLNEIMRDYAPLTPLVPSPTDLSAPATRGDVVRLLRALAVIAQAAPEAGAKYASDLADEIKEGRA